MITGFITLILFIVVCARSADKRIFKRYGILAKIHVPASIMLVAILIAHIVFIFPVLASRPVLALITGAAAVILITAACIAALKNKVKLHSVFAVCAALLIVSHIVLNITGVIEYQNRVKNTVVTNVDLSDIPDGVYTGEYDVMFIYAKVELTVAANKIADIAVLEHRNERGSSAEGITGTIVEKQNVDVEAVSGATNSSTVIKKAVENALLSAR